MGAGRKGKYNAKLVEKICQLIETDTFTAREICSIVGIHVATYFEWLNTKPEFNDAVTRAQEARKDFFVAEAKKSLLKKIQGYTVKEQHVTTIGTGKYDVNGKEIAKVKEQKTVDKHIQADTSAVIFTLCNCDPDNWKNRQSTEVTGKDGKDLFEKLTDEELNAKITALEKKLGQ